MPWQCKTVNVSPSVWDSLKPVADHLGTTPTLLMEKSYWFFHAMAKLPDLRLEKQEAASSPAK